MIHKIYAVRDKAVEAMLQPFFSPTLPSAIRSLSEVVNDKDHPFSKNVTDYTLYALGEFDDASGVITPAAIPDPVLNLVDLVRRIDG